MAEPVTMVVVGCGFGKRIVSDLSGGEHEVRVVGVCDLDQDLARRIAEQYRVPAYPDLASVLADDDVDAVGLFTGPSSRADLIAAIVAAGKHVLTTKPFALDPADAARAIRAARAADRVLHLNSPAPLASADLRQIESWCAEHELGAPVGARAETWADYRETADGSWYDDPLHCPVAPVLRLGVYLINDLVRIFGPAETVAVQANRLRTGRPTADNAQLALAFANGALGTVFASFCVGDGQVYPDALTLNFERGTIRRHTWRDPKAPLREPRSELSLTRPGAEQVRVTVPEISGRYEWDAFARAVRGAAVSTPVDVLLGGVAVLEAMARAERSGHTERVRPIGEVP